MRSVNTAERRLRLVAAILFVALNGSPACTLDTAGLLHEQPDIPEHGADADGGLDVRDDGVDRPDVTDLPDTTAEDAEPNDDGGEEAIEDDAGDVTEHEAGDVETLDDDAGEDDAAEDMEVVDEYLDYAEDEADAAETMLCDPTGSGDYCLGTILQQCDPSGTSWVETPCSLGCASGPARCLGVVPTNVSDRSLMRAGPGILAPASAVRWIRFSTNTGRIEAWDTSRNPLPDIRPAGAG
ncbi:MAG: hypothetical protein QME96_09670, partial [Myxococcota bacterium]|nr:hypothetical protein [Myxococcota bacterium]